MSKTATLLAIETSCDETAVAVLRREHDKISVLAAQVSSQVDIHALTGGVVPDVAAREHAAVLPPLLHQVVGESGVPLKDLDAIAVTVGPGLMPALTIGVTAARTLAFALNKKIVPVNHLEGHIYSALLPEINHLFPVLALIVSGGHTLLVLMPSHLQYQIIGSTRDDAAGEAFDKVARLLGLPYPGGPHLSKLAQTGNPAAFSLPRPMLQAKNYDFSFSGLKTAVLYTLRDQPQANRADLAASFEQAVVDVLAHKLRQAISYYRPHTLLLAGGVAANNKLRQKIASLARNESLPLRVAPPALCGDNAVMIGFAGLFALAAGRISPWQQVDAIARPSLASFSSSA